MIDVATVNIIGENASFVEAVESLARTAGFETRRYGSCGEFALSRRMDGPSCVILDIPGPDGTLDFHRPSSEPGECQPVVVVSEDGDVATSVWAMKAGAIDFLSRPFGDADMLAAIYLALECSSVTRSFVDETERVRDLYARLSRRERQIMQLVTTGLMNKQIAWDLGLSEVTVKIHRKSVVRKTGATSLADLVRMAAILGLHESGHSDELAKAAVASTIWIRTLSARSPELECCR